MASAQCIEICQNICACSAIGVWDAKSRERVHFGISNNIDGSEDTLSETVFQGQAKTKGEGRGEQ